MKFQEGVFLVAIFFFLGYTQLVKGQHQPRHDCQTRCGNLTIDYPFGISTGCYYPGDDSFNINCEEDKPNVLRNIEVRDFNHSGQLRVMLNRSTVCYDEERNNEFNAYQYKLDNLSLSPNNKFTLVGCNAWALLSTFGIQNYSTGCMSLCDSPPPPNSKCNGVGCCRTDVSIPLDSNRVVTRPSRFENMSSVEHFNPCSYAFLVEDGMFNFSALEDLKNLRNVKQFPVVLDWSIGNQTCEQVVGRNICGGNSRCFNSSRGKGYNCKCLDGFDGNPYLSDSDGRCKDINQCTSGKHNCSDPDTCRNKVGGFYCKCPFGYKLIATTESTMRCKRPEYIIWTQIFLGTTIGFLAILLGVRCIQKRKKHGKETEVRQKFFEQNGGGMLMQRLSGAGPSNVDVKIFTEEGMKEATNGYDESRILGQGGQGTVYKGILPDNSIVAIKKARLGDNSQVEQFINEVLVLSQINHRNVVKLLGCCLETEVPLLVYEFIASGTLYDHLHGSMFDSSLTWEHRLRIAIEIAGTLAYLHSSASIPIIHRDVKTANILLDENLTAKVADFGASRLIPMDKEELATMVQGTLGYLDPEYYNTGLLNEKSDVYSFGVVLMELLSGQKALCFERPQTSKHLVSYFASATKENRLHEIIYCHVMKEDNQRAMQKAARIAVECTRLTGEERPGMKEVAAELEALRVTKTKHKWSDDQYPKAMDTEHLVGIQNLSAQGETSSSIGYDSIRKVAILDIEAGR
ncbi:wall-associated receptor kinase 5 [Arabidopsis lyrata subsp. lyrata]|uniref:wall-associated receptor kinase 5 n=1 Tax=Arabidopsis lyrata subsp. lyrata TaxID=81972 RepID=UPI000A29B54C|nr:wall-associated receptor kinase 5 [Arabidopsis lyrata subsp. lyrata]|eukprot:XP_020869364.1 wall-associated receptor kinase 5 [Arabidopsis lyrata subsp. lyrata]